MWRLASVVSDDLPRLAWCAALTAGQERVVLFHGRWVEVDDSTFVEGAWSGRYAALDFSESFTFPGSGGRLLGHGLLCASATHSVEPLYVLRVGARLYCSNSLPLVLIAANDHIDPNYHYYDLDITSMAFGLKHCRPRIPTRNGQWVYLYYYCNILLSSELSVSVYAKKQPPPFVTYALPCLCE